jgi:hypothetical protein
MQVDTAVAAAAGKSSAQQHTEHYGNVYCTAGTPAPAIKLLPSTRGNPAVSSKRLLAVQSLSPCATIPDHAAAPQGPTVASAEFIAGLAAKISSTASFCSLPGQLAGGRSWYAATQLQTVTLDLPSRFAGGCKHAAAAPAAAALSTTAHPQHVKQIVHSSKQDMHESCSSFSNHLQHGHGLHRAAHDQGHAATAVLAAAAGPPIAGTLGAASIAAAASRLQKVLAGSHEAAPLQLPLLGRSAQRSPGAVQAAVLPPAACLPPATATGECQDTKQPKPYCNNASSSSNPTSAAGASQGAAALIDTYFDSIDKASKLDTPREDAAAALALGFAKSMAAGSARATTDNSISTASCTEQLAGRLGVAADSSRDSKADASLPAAVPAGISIETGEQQIAQQEVSRSFSQQITSPRAAVLALKRAAVPQLRLQQQQQQQQTCSQWFSSSTISSRSSAAAAMQEFCGALHERANRGALPLLASTSPQASGSSIDDLLMVSSSRSSRLAFPCHMLESPATAATSATMRIQPCSSEQSGHQQGAAGGAGSQLDQTVRLFGALPALGSPRGTWASQGGCSSSNSTAGNSGAECIKLTARVLAQEPADPAPGIILAPWKEQRQHARTQV